MDGRRPFSSLENFGRLMGNDGPRWLPLDLPMTPPVSEQMKARKGTGDAQEAFATDFRYVGTHVPSDQRAWRAAYEQLGSPVAADAEVGFAGITHRVPPAVSLGAASHLREMTHPLEVITSLQQLPSLPWPDYDAPGLGAGLTGQVAAVHQRGLVAVASLECTVFEKAWYLRGMDSLFMDLHDGNGIADWLLNYFAHGSSVLAGLIAAAGVDVIGLGDDVASQQGMLMSPDFWRTHLKPRLAGVIETVRCAQGNRHVYIRYHSDGDISEIIDDLIEIGVDILNPVQPECMSVDAVVERYRDRLAFWGMVGTQTTMPFGSTDDVRAVVRRIAEHANRGARVIVAPTHVLEPDVPWCNIEALVDAVRAEA